MHFAPLYTSVSKTFQFRSPQIGNPTPFFVEQDKTKKLAFLLSNRFYSPPRTQNVNTTLNQKKYFLFFFLPHALGFCVSLTFIKKLSHHNLQGAYCSAGVPSGTCFREWVETLAGRGVLWPLSYATATGGWPGCAQKWRKPCFVFLCVSASRLASLLCISSNIRWLSPSVDTPRS